MESKSNEQLERYEYWLRLNQVYAIQYSEDFPPEKLELVMRKLGCYNVDNIQNKHSTSIK